MVGRLAGTDLNEVLSIRAQELSCLTLRPLLLTNLNEVLSIRAQEFVNTMWNGYDDTATSMKS